MTLDEDIEKLLNEELNVEQFKSLVKNEKLNRLFEFAFDRNKIEDKIQNQSLAFTEHLLKAQLFHESTSYQTLYNIYLILRRIRQTDKNKYFDKQYYIDNISEGFIPDENVYKEQVEDFKVVYKNDYSEIFTENYEKYHSASLYIIDKVFDISAIDRDEFYLNIKNILE